jgi:hypothetical protein
VVATLATTTNATSVRDDHMVSGGSGDNGTVGSIVAVATTAIGVTVAHNRVVEVSSDVSVDIRVVDETAIIVRRTAAGVYAEVPHRQRHHIALDVGGRLHSRGEGARSRDARQFSSHMHRESCG